MDPINTVAPLERESNLAMIQGIFGWRDFVRENFPWLEVGSTAKDSFKAEVQSHRLGASALATIRSANTEVTRTSHLAERSDAGFVKVMWQVAGTMEIEQDRRRSLITPGEACICDTARPYRVALSDGSQFAVLTLPYEAIPGWTKISQRLCGAPLQDSVTARASLGALMALLRMPDQGDAEGSENVLRAIQWMLSASLHKSALIPGVVDRDASRISKAQMYVLDHLADPDLNPDDLASALHMSRRALYLLFKEYRMTPARMIHDLRLERCHKALVESIHKGQSVTEIAFENGYTDTATFSRLFKTQYGITPSECRQKALGSSMKF